MDGDGGGVPPLRGGLRRPRPHGGQPRARGLRQAGRGRGQGRPAPHLRRPGPGPGPRHRHDPRGVSRPTAWWSTACSWARSRWRCGPRASRPAVACVGVMPYSQPSRDTAPFGIGMQPGRGPLARLRNRTLNWLAVHGALADIQRFTRARLAEAGAPGVKTYLLDLQPTLTDAYFQATVSRVRVSAFGPGADGALRGADPGAAPSASSARPLISSSASTPPTPFVVARPVRRPPGGARHPGHARQRRPGPAPAPDHRRAVRRRRAGRRHHRWPGPRAAPRLACRTTRGSSASSPTTSSCPGSTSW